jgi:hypothetical protein
MFLTPIGAGEPAVAGFPARLHKELKSRKSVTLQLLWEEYKEANRQRSGFMARSREFRLTMLLHGQLGGSRRV